ncbi:MAG: hypothetical protein L0Z62_06400 [Gemmataceae bacterium]|nr:hypothetical protein [Gemmataceae bacterium]
MSRLKTLVVCLTCVLGLGLVLLDSDSAAGGGKPKIDPKRLKAILKRVDPEIRAAQKALREARGKLMTAINDEVFGEKGATEGRVVDFLRAALKNVDQALANTKKAQIVDKGGD